MMAIVMSEQIS